jgi:hypothetical protein
MFRHVCILQVHRRRDDTNHDWRIQSMSRIDDKVGPRATRVAHVRPLSSPDRNMKSLTYQTTLFPGPRYRVRTCSIASMEPCRKLAVTGNGSGDNSHIRIYCSKLSPPRQYQRFRRRELGICRVEASNFPLLTREIWMASYSKL